MGGRRHRFVFVESDSRNFRIREKTERYQAIARVSRATVKVSLDNAEVVLRDVRELRAARALAQSPDAGRRRFEAFVHLNVSTRVQGHAGFVEANVPRLGIRPTATRISLPSTSDVPVEVARVARTEPPDEPSTFSTSTFK